MILMDVMMPVMDGLTANAFAEDREQSKKAGMNEHISKPLREEAVLRALKKYLFGKRKEA